MCQIFKQSCCLQNTLIICVWENHGKGYLNNFPITEFKANTCLFQSESNTAIMDSIPGFKKNYKLITYSYFNIFIPYFFSADFIDCYPPFHIHQSKSVFYFLSSYIIFYSIQASKFCCPSSQATHFSNSYNFPSLRFSRPTLPLIPPDHQLR